MKIKKFALTPESIISTQELSSLYGGNKPKIELPKPGTPLPEPPIITFPCDNA